MQTREGLKRSMSLSGVNFQDRQPLLKSTSQGSSSETLGFSDSAVVARLLPLALPYARSPRLPKIYTVSPKVPTQAFSGRNCTFSPDARDGAPL
jgi:hypothetical protein